MFWHVDETYFRVSGIWRYLWRIVDEHSRVVDFRLTARRDAKAAKAFLSQACRDSGAVPTYPAIIRSMHSHAYSGQPVKHIDQKWCNNRIESDHASLKRITDPGKGFLLL